MIKEYVVKITDDVIPDGFARFEDEYSPELELVRCKDCKYVECEGVGGFLVCELSGFSHYPEFFCADAERREKDDG